MRGGSSWWVSLAVAALTSIAMVPGAPAQTVVPGLINYQGRLVDGSELVNGRERIVFSIYDGNPTTVRSRTSGVARTRPMPCATIRS